MRLPLEIRFLLGSAALHVAAGVAVYFLKPYQTFAPSTAIEVAVSVRAPERAPEVPAPAPAIEQPAVPERAKRAPERSPERATERRDVPTDEQQVSPSVPAPPALQPAPSDDPTPRRIDLFAPKALAVALPSSGTLVVKRDWGGTTRRVGDGQPVPGTRDVAADREEAAVNVRRFFDQATGEERARSGRIPPRWREAERRMDTDFRPPRALVTDAGAGETFLKQVLAARPRGGDTRRGVDPSVEAANLPYAQALAATAATGAAASWVRAEIEVVIDESGRVVSARVLSPSGRRKFDQAALEAVRKAIDGHGALDEKTAVVTRWAVEASMAVAPPTSLGFGFDESSGRVAGSYPMKKEVKTRVALLSVSPRR
ncbi:MAG: energy transducer TonB [Myxococcales bacterium]|nr:energy transducer TonB [Myxococcales bacterium]